MSVCCFCMRRCDHIINKLHAKLQMSSSSLAPRPNQSSTASEESPAGRWRLCADNYLTKFWRSDFHSHREFQVISLNILRLLSGSRWFLRRVVTGGALLSLLDGVAGVMWPPRRDRGLVSLQDLLTSSCLKRLWDTQECGPVTPLTALSRPSLDTTTPQPPAALIRKLNPPNRICGLSIKTNKAIHWTDLFCSD